MSATVTSTPVAEYPGLFFFQARLDVRRPLPDDFGERRRLAEGFARNSTPAHLSTRMPVKWAVNTDFIPGFIMSLDWYAEETSS